MQLAFEVKSDPRIKSYHINFICCHALLALYMFSPYFDEATSPKSAKSGLAHVDRLGFQPTVKTSTSSFLDRNYGNVRFGLNILEAIKREIQTDIN